MAYRKRELKTLAAHEIFCDFPRCDEFVFSLEDKLSAETYAYELNWLPLRYGGVLHHYCPLHSQAAPT